MFLNSRGICTLLAALVLCCVASTAFGQGTNGVLQPAGDRRLAPELMLQDSVGKQANLHDYRGNVVILDFWATWCHGCKEEIPWFAEFHRKYAKRGFAVIGVSLDDDGWKVIKPFIEKASVPYRIVLGNSATAKAYGIKSMPDTFLIDQNGRIAAAYVGMVDRSGLEKNIETLLSQK